MGVQERSVAGCKTALTSSAVKPSPGLVSLGSLGCGAVEGDFEAWKKDWMEGNWGGMVVLGDGGVEVRLG